MIMGHADLLKLLLPPESLDPAQSALFAELAAEGAALDLAQWSADQVLQELDPRTTSSMLADWERVYALPDADLPRETRTLPSGLHAVTASEIASFSRASTGTVTGSDGELRVVAAGAPRFVYDAVTLAPKGLLIEPAATNLCRYSEQFENAAWSKARMTVSANVAVAPDGSMTADKFVEYATNNSYYIYQPINCSAGQVYSLSVYVCAAERSRVMLMAYMTNGTFAGETVKFDLSVGTVTAVIGSPVAYGIEPQKHGYYRVWISVQALATANGKITLQTLDADGNDTYMGDGVSGVFIWGCQYEAGLPSSYIPTVSAPVTRAADVCVVFIEPSMAQRRAALVALVTMLGGQSIAFLVGLAGEFGYSITIEECRPQTTEDATETPARDEQFRFVWIVHAQLTSLLELTTEDGTEMPTATWSNALLETRIRRFKPAHTYVIFSYS